MIGGDTCMNENKILNEQSAHIIRLDGQNSSFEEKNGFLALTLDLNGERKQYCRIFLHRAFPFELGYEFISVLDDEKNEIGIIYDVADFDGESANLIKREIEKKYYSPAISEIKSLKERYGFSYWKVTLEDGREQSFTMQDTYKNILHISDDSIILVDVDSNRYTIKSISSLSSKSYRKIELYL